MEAAEQAQSVCIGLKTGSWSEDAERWLSLTGPEHLAEYYDQYRAGARLIYVTNRREIVGALLLRIDISATGADGVIVAAGVLVPGVDLVKHVLPAVERLFLGVDAIRVHTSRPGLIKKLRESGYVESEVVLRKQVKKCIYH